MKAVQINQYCWTSREDTEEEKALEKNYSKIVLRPDGGHNTPEPWIRLSFEIVTTQVNSEENASSFMHKLTTLMRKKNPSLEYDCHGGNDADCTQHFTISFDCASTEIISLPKKLSEIETAVKKLGAKVDWGPFVKMCHNGP